ncbi:hypothetical protein HZ326_3134 [Fusarium oxysporum f. sp. albedinis]|nr:hypothetical protein HZ326_3134 [Fusarium oxysporum f. sp. albedinis]
MAVTAVLAKWQISYNVAFKIKATPWLIRQDSCHAKLAWDSSRGSKADTPGGLSNCSHLLEGKRGTPRRFQ